MNIEDIANNTNPDLYLFRFNDDKRMYGEVESVNYLNANLSVKEMVDELANKTNIFAHISQFLTKITLEQLAKIQHNYPHIGVYRRLKDEPSRTLNRNSRQTYNGMTFWDITKYDLFIPNEDFNACFGDTDEA